MGDLSIELNKIQKKLGDRQVLKDITFKVEKGDIFGFLGPNGAGKTTTIRTIMGLYRADGGTVRILGGNPDNADTRQKVGFVLDRDGLYSSLSAEENLRCFLQLYGKPVTDKAVRDALMAVGLENRAHDKVGAFSKGMRQRVAIARSIVHDPEVVILDEPTSGVDPTEQMNLREYLVKISKERGKTIFLSTHNMDEVQKICNKIAILNKGCIQVTGDLNEIEKQYGQDKITVTVGVDLTDKQITQLKKSKELGFEQQNGNRLVFSPQEGIKTGKIVQVLSEMNIETDEITSNQMNLEDMYAAVIKEGEKDE